MKYAIGGVLVGLCVLLVAQMAFATTATGPIDRLRINPGATPVRMSIHITGARTACPASEWYAYEMADTGLGLVMTKGLLSAYNSGQPIQIVGTGTCDRFGVEQIAYIDLIRDIP